MGMFHRHGKGHDHPPFDRDQLRGTLGQAGSRT